MVRGRQGLTLIELVMIIVIVGILTTIAIAKFIDFKQAALNARGEGYIAALNSASYIYYSKTALSTYEHLCTAAGNPYRHSDVPAPCYPASYEELESLLNHPPDWGSGSGGACYDSQTGQVTSCQ